MRRVHFQTLIASWNPIPKYSLSLDLWRGAQASRLCATLCSLVRMGMVFSSIPVSARPRRPCTLLCYANAIFIKTFESVANSATLPHRPSAKIPRQHFLQRGHGVPQPLAQSVCLRGGGEWGSKNSCASCGQRPFFSIVTEHFQQLPHAVAAPARLLDFFHRGGFQNLAVENSLELAARKRTATLRPLRVDPAGGAIMRGAWLLKLQLPVAPLCFQSLR